MIYKEGKCGRCEFSRNEIKEVKFTTYDWSDWHWTQRFFEKPVERYMGHNGPVTVCPPAGPNYRGAIRDLIP